MAMAPLNDLAHRIHEVNKANGWWDLGPEERNFGELLALVHSEVSEALEEYRAGRRVNENYYNPDKPTKLEGIPSELADVIIRVLDICAAYRISIDSVVREKVVYNAKRGYKHGGKVI